MNKEIVQRQIIKPTRPSALKLLFFWLLVFLLPILTIKLLLNTYINAAIEEAFLRDSQVLKTELDTFEQDLKLEKVLLQAISKMESSVPHILPDKNSHTELNQLCLTTAKFLKLSGRCPAALIIAYDPSSKECGYFNDPAGQFTIGKRTAEILLSSIGGTEHLSGTPQKKRFTQIAKSVFGGLLDLPEAPGTLRIGFTCKDRTDKIFTYFNFYQNQQSRRIKMFLVFSENMFNPDTIICSAMKTTNPEITRSIKLLRTLPDRGFTKTTDHQLIFSSPLGPEVLRIGSHMNRSWFNKAISSGLALQKPAKLPFATVTIKSGRNAVAIHNFVPLINLGLLLLAFAGLLLLKQTLTGALPADNVKTRFRLAILFATMMPFTAFLVTSHQFIGHFNNVVTRTRLQNLRNELIMLEMNIKNSEKISREKISRFVKDVKSRKSEKSDRLKTILDKETSSLYEGYSFLRNDGTLIEKLPPTTIASEKDYQKLLLLRELLLAQIFNIFEFSSAITPEHFANFRKLPGFRKWQAYSGHFTLIDKNSFCRQDGHFYQAKQADSNHFSISTHNMLPEVTSDNIFAFLMLISDSKKTVENFLAKQNENPKNFLHRDGDYLTHTAIFRCHDSSLNDIDASACWPGKAVRDQRLLEAARKINAKNLQSSWLKTDSAGMTTLFVAKAVSGLPFIMVATSQISLNAQRQSLLLIILTLLAAYSFLLTYLISSVLSEIFVSPINLIVKGIAALQQNHYPRLLHNSDNEFGHLIDEFNSMTEGMRQRHLLERFISQEVSQAIAIETDSLHETSAQLVFRVVLFIHIRHFASISESITPENSITLLNLYFSKIEPVISRSGGQIDKYIGDAIMVSFAPTGDNDKKSEIAACNAAVLCCQALTQLNDELNQRRLPQIKLGFGIAAGQVICGKIGSRQGRQDFTIIGDAVNLAARLESISHFSETSNILVSEEVNQEVSHAFASHEQGQVKIKGKEKAVKVYQIKENCLDH